MAGVDKAKLLGDEARPDPLVGRLIRGRYRVIRELATGHTGVVYLAQEEITANRVAVKVLHADYAKDEKFVKELRRLMLAVAALSKTHRNIVRVYDCDQAEDGSLFIAMEQLEGRTLSDVMRQAGALEIGRALHLALQMAEGLSAAHDAGIVHTDIQPQNFMLLGKEEALKIIGFERARLKNAGAMDHLLGSRVILRAPEYVAPEQIEGRKITHQTDIYAFGVVLYQMLTGVVPFRASTPEAVLAMHLQTAPTPLKALRPEVPVVVEAQVLQALEKKPKWREKNVNDVVGEFLRELVAERARGKGGPIHGMRTALQAGIDRARSIATKCGKARPGWKLAVVIGLLILVAVPPLWMASSRKTPGVPSAESPNQSPEAGPGPEAAIAPRQKPGTTPAIARESEKAKEIPLLPSQDSQARTSPETSPPKSASQEAEKPAEKKSTSAPNHRKAKSPRNARILAAPRRKAPDTQAPETQAPNTKAEAQGGPPDPTEVIDWLLKHR